MEEIIKTTEEEKIETTKDIREKRTPLYKKLVKWMWGLAIFGAVSIGLLFFVLSFSDLPTFEELENQTSLLCI